MILQNYYFYANLNNIIGLLWTHFLLSKDLSVKIIWFFPVLYLQKCILKFLALRTELNYCYLKVNAQLNKVVLLLLNWGWIYKFWDKHCFDLKKYWTFSEEKKNAKK